MTKSPPIALTLMLFLALPAARADEAEVIAIGPESAAKLPRGKEADAIAGDFLIRNDRLAATIGGVAAFRDANVNTQAVQGAVLDLVRLDPSGGSVDLISAYYPQGHYLDAPAPTAAEINRARGEVATIRFRRAATPSMQGDPVDVETEYSLRVGEPFLRVITTYSNPSDRPAHAAVYDKIRADGLFKIPPAGDAPHLIYDDPWNGSTYGVVRKDAAALRSYATPASKTYFLEGGNRLDLPELLEASARPIGEFLPGPTTIPPHGRLVVERYLIPGRHVADVQDVVARLSGRPVAGLPVRVVDPEGKPVAGAVVRAKDGDATISEGRTDAAGLVDLVVAPGGKYALEIAGRGRADVKADAEAGGPRKDVAIGPESRAEFDVWDVTSGRARGPVKVLIKGGDGTPDPDFGPDSLPYRAGKLAFSATGSFSVPIPPGKYEATFGRGPEYNTTRKAFVVGYGAPAKVEAEIRRAFATPGWILADFHNHTTASNDSIADRGGRVVGLAAAGLEFAPATEHNRITSFDDAIEAEGLKAFLRSAGGIELSGRPGPGQINHQNAFPLRVQAGVQGGGAPQTDKDPKVQIGRLSHYDDDAEKFVQHNHPDVGWLYYDKDRDGKPDGGFGTLPFTHAIELNRDVVNILKDLEAAGPDAKRGTAFRWLQMLNQGHRLFAAANSDAHVTAFNNGSIFTYLQSDVEEPASLDPLALARSAKAGRMVLSNGPFMEVAIDDAPPGSEVKLGPESRLKVRVLCAEGIDVDRVEVLINGRPEPSLAWTRGESAAPAGPLRFERVSPLRLESDAHVVVVATGRKSKLGPFHGPYGQQPPTAISNPIFVDVDGGGFVANRDTLGVDLPVGSKKAGASGGE